MPILKSPCALFHGAYYFSACFCLPGCKISFELNFLVPSPFSNHANLLELRGGVGGVAGRAFHGSHGARGLRAHPSGRRRRSAACGALGALAFAARLWARQPVRGAARDFSPRRAGVAQVLGHCQAGDPGVEGPLRGLRALQPRLLQAQLGRAGVRRVQVPGLQQLQLRSVSLELPGGAVAGAGVDGFEGKSRSSGGQTLEKQEEEETGGQRQEQEGHRDCEWRQGRFFFFFCKRRW